MNFKPGLVGGHCIGVDPYYFTYKTEQLGYHSQIISAGRKINDEMGKFVANSIIKNMILNGQNVKNSTVAILGITFKENCGDVRNSKVIDIVKELIDYEINVIVADPLADKEEVRKEYGIDLIELSAIDNVDCIAIAVNHEHFKSAMRTETLESLYKKSIEKKVLIDVKNMISKKEWENRNNIYWSL